MTKVIDVKHVEKIYGKKNEKQYRALKDISFSMEPGEFVGVMGASGSGKTTLLNIISTLDKPTSGEVLIDGDDITKLQKDQLSDFRAEKIGFIFQDFNLLESLTNRENIALPLTLQGVNAKEITEKVEKVAKRLNILEILDKYPAEISGGQKQRVAASRALVHNPQILFGDEPTGALDSKSAEELLKTMDDLNSNDDVSILMVTHDPVSASYASRILFIKDGQINQELVRGDKTREEFFKDIIDHVSEND